ncbi:PTS sugar transporter subunit IIA [bacterium]|nr:PTS sugar transporter subunit IIA [bacterium]
MGAAPTRTLLGHLVGTKKDNLTRRAECSVLCLKTPFLQTHEVFDIEHLPVEQEFDLLSFVDPKCVEVNIKESKKESLFRTATERLSIHYPEISPIVINSALWEREQLQSTSVGQGVAIPHATLTQAGATATAIAISTTAKPIDYAAPNQEEVRTIKIIERSVIDGSIALQTYGTIRRIPYRYHLDRVTIRVRVIVDDIDIFESILCS